MSIRVTTARRNGSYDRVEKRDAEYPAEVQTMVHWQGVRKVIVDYGDDDLVIYRAMPPCPHCGEEVLDRGATGLDECTNCGGLSRGGNPLHERGRIQT